MKARLVILMLCAVPLAGCETLKGSIAGGECRIFERPEYAVRGARQYDQAWIDGNVEAGVGGCGWKRPHARPASIDASTVHQTAKAPTAKRGFLKRIKDRAVDPFTARVAPVIESPPVAPELSLPKMAEPPRAPRDPVDELLGN